MSNNEIKDTSETSFTTIDTSQGNQSYNLNSGEFVTEQLLLMRMKLEHLRDKKKLLESENDNLNCKINDLRLIIDRISKENDD